MHIFVFLNEKRKWREIWWARHPLLLPRGEAISIGENQAGCNSKPHHTAGLERCVQGLRGAHKFASPSLGSSFPSASASRPHKGANVQVLPSRTRVLVQNQPSPCEQEHTYPPPVVLPQRLSSARRRAAPRKAPGARPQPHLP